MQNCHKVQFQCLVFSVGGGQRAGLCHPSGGWGGGGKGIRGRNRDRGWGYESEESGLVQIQGGCLRQGWAARRKENIIIFYFGINFHVTTESQGNFLLLLRKDYMQVVLLTNID